MSIHFWQCSYHRQTAVANNLVVIPLMTPSHSVLMLRGPSWCMPAHSSGAEIRSPPVSSHASRVGGKDLDAVDSQLVLNDRGTMDWIIVPVEKNPGTPSLASWSSAASWRCQELEDVDVIDGGTPGQYVSIDEALSVKQCQQHLFAMAGMDLGLYWARLSLLNSLLGLF